jgi:mRNA interferase MazF
VLISRNDAYLYRDLVLVAQVSGRIRGLEAEVFLGPEDGLPHASAANLDSISTIPKASLQRFIATLSDEKLQAVDAAIRYALGLDG